MIDNQQTVGHRTLILRFRRRRESRIWISSLFVRLLLF